MPPAGRRRRGPVDPAGNRAAPGRALGVNAADPCNRGLAEALLHRRYDFLAWMPLEANLPGRRVQVAIPPYLAYGNRQIVLDNQKAIDLQSRMAHPIRAFARPPRARPAAEQPRVIAVPDA